MTNGPGAQLPNHVLKYLEKKDVDPSQLTPEALETLAGLSIGEVAVLKIVGKSLEGVEDKDVALRVH
jgi:hypothetical protein